MFTRHRSESAKPSAGKPAKQPGTSKNAGPASARDPLSGALAMGRAPASVRAAPSSRANADPAERDQDAVLGRIDAFRGVVDQHMSGFRAAVDALDVDTIALVASVLEADAATLSALHRQAAASGGASWETRFRLAALEATFRGKIGVHVGLQRFRGQAILGSQRDRLRGGDPVAWLHTEVPQILRMVHASRQIEDIASRPQLSFADTVRLHALLESGRAVDVLFKTAVLRKLGLWDQLHAQPYGRVVLESALRRAHRLRDDFGDFADAGDFDLSRARALLDRGLTDWAITDGDAQEVVRMLGSAPTQDGREAILGKLLEVGKLDELAANLPWRVVQQLHDMTSDEAVREALLPHFREHIDKGAGESLAKMYDRWGVSQARAAQESDSWLGAAAHYGLSYGAAFLHTAHNGLTLGFLDTYSQAYDLREQGLISDDALYQTTAAALARSGATLAAMILTGGTTAGVVGGLGRGLGMSRTAASVLGNVTGGAAAGTSGQLTADLMGMALLGQEGFSSGKDYLVAAGLGALIGGVAAGAEARFPASARVTADVYAQQHPWLYRLIKASQQRGTRLAAGRKVRITLHHGTSTEAVVRIREGIRVDTNAPNPGRTQIGSGFYTADQLAPAQRYAAQTGSPEVLSFEGVAVERLGTVLDLTTGQGLSRWNAFMEAEVLPGTGYTRRTLWNMNAEARGGFVEEHLQLNGLDPDVIIAEHDGVGKQIVIRTQAAADRLQAYAPGALQAAPVPPLPVSGSEEPQ